MSTFGASIVKLELPDRDGKVDDCVLGFDSVAEYDRGREHTNFFGATVGRVANRIAGSSFTIDGVSTQLDVNEGEKNHLHGGDLSWHRKHWESREILNGVEFSYLSADGDMKYPGRVRVSVRYTLNDGKLKVQFEAHLDAAEKKSTPINLTNHSYFNLAGHTSENGILSHELEVYADHYTPTDSASIPTREAKSLDEVPSMDFRKAKQIDAALRELAAASGYSAEEMEDAIQRKGRGASEPLGFDHNYCLNFFHSAGEYANCPIRAIAKLSHRDSGRVMKVSSTSPGVQVYTGNYIGECSGKNGFVYRQRAGICLETQTYPDAISPDASKHPEFSKGACFILKPGGKPYFHDVVYSFEIEDSASEALMKMLE